MAGDVHRKGAWFGHLCSVARDEGADTILQLGDFGFWEHKPVGVQFLDEVEGHLAELDRPCVWIDGNHENHTLLRAAYGPGPDGFVPVRQRLSYAPRGLRWIWDGVSFLAMGGAPSFDQWMRTEGESWWPEEMLTEDEVAAASAAGSVDVLVSHDCPAGLFPPPRAGQSATVGAPAASPVQARVARIAEGFDRAHVHRQLLRTVVDAVRPRLVVHGHYHHRHSSRLVLDDGTDVQIEGLGRDNQGGDAWWVLDTATVAT